MKTRPAVLAVAIRGCCAVDVDWRYLVNYSDVRMSDDKIVISYAVQCPSRAVMYVGNVRYLKKAVLVGGRFMP